MPYEQLVVGTLDETFHRIDTRKITILFGMRFDDPPFEYTRRPNNLYCYPTSRMHPTEQAEWVQGVVKGRDGVPGDVIIHTNSVILILRILRLIRDGVLSTDEVTFYHVNTKEENPLTKLTPEGDGRFDKRIPDKFFSQDIEELFGESLGGDACHTP